MHQPLCIDYSLLVMESAGMMKMATDDGFPLRQGAGTGSDRGGGVPSFDEMVDFALVEVDFDDPTTNVRGRRALAIAKPTPRGY